MVEKKDVSYMEALSRLRRALACGVAAAVVVVSGLAAQAQAAPASTAPVDKTCGTPSVPAGGNCMSSLISSAFDMIKAERAAADINKLDNAAFTQNTATNLSAEFPGFNVMVFKTVGTDLFDSEFFVNEHTADMTGVLLDTTYKLKHFLDKDQKDPSGYDIFQIWVFQGDSTFRNRGDGGFMNWAFTGNDSDTVKEEPWTCRANTSRPYECDGDVRTLHFPARSGYATTTGSLTPDASSPGYHACLDVTGNGTANGTPVQMWECNGGASQKWTYNGYKLQAANGKCLDLEGNNNTNGTKLQIWDCEEIPGQRWHMSPSGSLRHMTDQDDRSKDICMNDLNGQTANGSTVAAWACGSADNRDTPSQNWAWGGTPPTTSGNRAIWVVNSDKTYVNTEYNRCMVRGPEFDSSKTGGLVTQHVCQSTAPSSHQWAAELPSSFDSKGYYWIKAGNGMCLTVPYNNGTPPSAGTQLFWWGCETRWFSGSQMWNIIPTKVGTKGAYMFINNWTGLCLSMDPATASASGGKVTQDTCPK
ncbi:RICIN domain-containing protein [Streptomyces sp. RPA4-2]|uniref:RICIN domain-containing protein n=2 Tax=Streptomyces TaxID=1883 RepID=UPI00143EB865|nr:RICIN domain-containing protein [Streptomyces sp. RPA4-2]QIY66658.1 hypothetical protein HEP85_40865 [Streptomyces sp. RPA4-2]